MGNCIDLEKNKQPNLFFIEMFIIQLADHSFVLLYDFIKLNLQSYTRVLLKIIYKATTKYYKMLLSLSVNVIVKVLKQIHTKITFIK